MSPRLSGCPIRTTPMKTISEQALGTHLRTRRLPDDTRFQIDAPVPKGRAVLVRLGHEAQPHPRRLPADARNESRSEALHETLAGAQRERSDEASEVELLGGAQNGFRVVHEPADPLAKLERSGRRNETASGPDQQGIARRLAQPRERPAHRGRAEPQSTGGARDTAFGEQHVQGDEQVEIGHGHASTVTRPGRHVWRHMHE